MLYRYSDFILKENMSNAKHLYWNNETFEEALNKDWTEIKITEEKGNTNLYDISFRIGPDKYDVCAVILDNRDRKENYLLNGEDMIKEFIQKFKTEFWKNASEYIKNMDYDPKCLGDVEHVRNAENYNM